MDFGNLLLFRESASVFAFSSLFGLAVGSFLNVLIFRLPAGHGLGGRSRCPQCGKAIRWYHNVPVVSFVLLGGRCADCRRPISWRYPAVELVTAALFVLVAWQHFGGEGFGGDAAALIRNSQFVIRDWFFIVVLILVFVIDLERYLILDSVTLPAAALALAANLLLGLPWATLVLGGILGGAFFGLQYLLSRGRWIGDGDIRLGVLLGVMLGWKLLLVTLMLAYGVGSLVGLALVSTGRKQLGSRLPLGTFLAGGGIIALLWGEAATRAYQQFVFF